MDLHYLKIFNTMATELSFSKTAKKLYISQPAVSIQIRKFEENLGVKLFDKVGRRIYLNENGKLLYEYTKKIFSLIDEAETMLNNQNEIVKGTISIGASNTPGTYILPKILGEFKEMYPYANTSLHIANTSEVEKMVFENVVDFAVIGGEVVRNSTLYAEKIMEDEIVFVASPNGELSEKPYIEAKDLKNIKYISHEKDSKLYKILVDILHELKLPVSISMILGNIDAIKQAVAAGLGISIVPKSAIKMESDFGLLRELRIKDKHWSYPYYLIYHKSRQHSHGTLELIKMIRKRTSHIAFN